jgi:uncharacterized membrane protein YphA (DoxX/SURF4 family)
MVVTGHLLSLVITLEVIAGAAIMIGERTRSSNIFFTGFSVMCIHFSCWSFKSRLNDPFYEKHFN